ncbi:hypothetical protein BC831DRAFT_459581 [Entophlyctis helioformis]|nr:hypothetical protein BC831DRAFT_459581 [Entophlyctis helioformis]
MLALTAMHSMACRRATTACLVWPVQAKPSPQRLLVAPTRSRQPPLLLPPPSDHCPADTSRPSDRNSSAMSVSTRMP